MSYFREALRYYEPLQQVNDYVDSFFLSELASCYRETGLGAEADACYKQIIGSDSGNLQSRNQVAKSPLDTRADQRELRVGSEVVARDRHKTWRRNRPKNSKRSGGRTLLQTSEGTILPKSPYAQQGAKQFTTKKSQVEEDEVFALFARRQSLERNVGGFQLGDREWRAATKSLLDIFRENKVFYPFERHQRFYGYSKEARAMASRSRHELDEMFKSPQSAFGMFDKILIRLVPKLISGPRNTGRRPTCYSRHILQDSVRILAEHVS